MPPGIDDLPLTMLYDTMLGFRQHPAEMGHVQQIGPEWVCYSSTVKETTPDVYTKVVFMPKGAFDN